MLIEIRHVTRYRYLATARYSIQVLRLFPQGFEGQRVLDWMVSAPGLERGAAFRDGFGNSARLLTLIEPHDEIEIVASGTVETTDRSGMVSGLVEPCPLRVYLRETPRTASNEQLRSLGAQAQARGQDTLARMHALMAAVHEAVAYRIGTTHEHTCAAEALEDGQGVCQDHAHVFISAARASGIPCRYVNGYFLNGADAPSEAHHAWAEAWIDGLGWVGFDPANGTCPTDRYVRLAWGLDAGSAAPIRGAQRGGANEGLDVLVEVSQQGAQQ